MKPVDAVEELFAVVWLPAVVPLPEPAPRRPWWQRDNVMGVLLIVTGMALDLAGHLAG